jgi:acyl-CoA thioester hydrolase
MEINEVDIQVRFNEVDEMGIVHNSVYFVWFEIARYNFALKALQISYHDLKNIGILVPVVHAECNYKKPAVYPDNLRVSCFIEPTETAVLILHYKIIRESNHDLIATGKTINAFTDINGTLKIKFPDIIQQAVNKIQGEPSFLWKG